MAGLVRPQRRGRRPRVARPRHRPHPLSPTTTTATCPTPSPSSPGPRPGPDHCRQRAEGKARDATPPSRSPLVHLTRADQRNLRSLACDRRRRTAAPDIVCKGSTTCVQRSGASSGSSVCSRHSASWPAPAAATSKTSTTDTTVAGASSDVDYSTLTGTLNGSGSTFQKAFYEEAIAAFKDVAPAHPELRRRRLGQGQQDLADQLVDFAGTDAPSRTRTGQVQGRRGPLLPDRGRADHGLLQPERRRQAAAQRRHARQDLQAPDQDLERPGHRRRQPRRDPAGTPITVVAPLRRLGHHQQLHQVPRGRRARRPGRSTPVTPCNWPADTQAGQRQRRRGPDRQAAPTAPSATSTSPTPRPAGLTFASVKNKAGKFVAPTLDGATRPLAGADDQARPDLQPARTPPAPTPTRSPRRPRSSSTQNQTDKPRATALKGWLNCVLTDGQELAADVDFAKLPDAACQQQGASPSSTRSRSA